MRVIGRYLLLLLAAAAAPAEEPEYCRVNCTVVAPDLPGGLRCVKAVLKFERVDAREFARVTFRDDGQGSANLARGGHYRVRPLGLILASGHRPFSVRREFIRIEPAEVWIPSLGPVPEPQFMLGIPRGDHVLHLKVSARTGQPTPGARIRVAHRTAVKQRRASVPYGVHETNAAGEVAVEGLPAGRYRATLIDDGPYGVAVGTATDEVSVGGRDARAGEFIVEAAGCLRVTVDTRGMPEAPPVAVWSSFARLVAGPKVVPDAKGPGAIYQFSSLRPGRYRVVATLPDGSTMLREAEVQALAVTPVQLSRRSNRKRPFEFMARWETMPPDLTRTRWYLTALRQDEFPTTVLEAPRGGALNRTYGPDPRAGAYLVRYPAQGLARLLELNRRRAWGIDLTPPKSGYLRRGHRTVRVRVLRGGKPVSDLFVGLQERKRLGTEDEKWMRYAATTAKGAEFREVPAGWYRINFLDRVLGANVGDVPKPRMLSIWRDDIDLTIELNE